ncbi:MAG: aspartate/glutamate racemase family protein [Candidatus Berkelbacteria bacterium]|nr:aspartate/glutamate racemase family protein [Candidatus Berkelbacteria bacterium]
MKPKIGLLGGIGPESSAKFYELLIKKVQSLGVESNTEYPYIILESVPAPELFLENPDLTMYKQGVKNLEKAGANFIVIICNTAHIFINEFKELVNIPIIDLNKETEKVLKRNKIKSITVFGSRRTINKLFRFQDILLHKISAEDSKVIDEIILKYNRGENKRKLEEKFVKIINKYSQKDILIACTELSTISRNRGLEHLDTFDILLDATLKKWGAV